jgi:hypothetical protein
MNQGVGSKLLLRQHHNSLWWEAKYPIKVKKKPLKRLRMGQPSYLNHPDESGCWLKIDN